jgi:hypothetical protein
MIIITFSLTKVRRQKMNEEMVIDIGSQAGAQGGAMSGLSLFIQLIVLLIVIVAWWKLFTKAGKPGWASIIPIYNMIVFLQIAKKPVWWIILYFIPVVNIVIGIIATAAFAKTFGKGTGFVVGLILLPFIFYPILAFGSAQYQVEQEQQQAEPAATPEQSQQPQQPEQEEDKPSAG